MIAIVGAGGATGLECVRKCLAEGKSVRVVVRDPKKYAGKFDSAEVVAGDVTDEASLKAAFSGCASVVFAASASKFSGAGGPYEVDYLGIQKTASAALDAKVSKLVMVSSRLVNPINRWHPIRGILNNIKWRLMDYKFQGEEALRQSGIDYTIVRPGGLSGGDGQRETKATPAEEHVLAAAAEGDLGSERGIHRTNVAAVVYEALQSTDASKKTIEIVARARAEGDASQEDHMKGIFKDIPVDSQGADAGSCPCVSR
jgi:uncharacterized protein YbjT (DUF2867 family)